jgi:hypothetical protein
MAHRGGAPHRGDSTEWSSQRRAGGEAGNAAEVADEHHGATEELGDAKEAPDDRWRRLFAVVRSAVHDTKENQCGGSRARSMVAGCRVREAHHVRVVLRVVPAGTARAIDHLSLMLASTASADGRRLRGGL